MAKKGILERLAEGVVLGDGGYLLELEKRGWVRGGPFTPEVACSDLVIVAATYDARATITKKTNLPKRDVLSSGAAIAARMTKVAQPGVSSDNCESSGTVVAIATVATMKK